jgi:hypothetical protein
MGPGREVGRKEIGHGVQGDKKRAGGPPKEAPAINRGPGREMLAFAMRSWTRLNKGGDVNSFLLA